jgi:hypothetical protein
MPRIIIVWPVVLVCHENVLRVITLSNACPLLYMQFLFFKAVEIDDDHEDQPGEKNGQQGVSTSDMEPDSEAGGDSGITDHSSHHLLIFKNGWQLGL